MSCTVPPNSKTEVRAEGKERMINERKRNWNKQKMARKEREREEPLESAEFCICPFNTLEKPVAIHNTTQQFSSDF